MIEQHNRAIKPHMMQIRFWPLLSSELFKNFLGKSWKLCFHISDRFLDFQTSLTSSLLKASKALKQQWSVHILHKILSAESSYFLVAKLVQLSTTLRLKKRNLMNKHCTQWKPVTHVRALASISFNVIPWIFQKHEIYINYIVLLSYFLFYVQNNIMVVYYYN